MSGLAFAEGNVADESIRTLKDDDADTVGPVVFRDVSKGGEEVKSDAVSGR